MQFAIHESNIDRLNAKITRIRNKCLKYGCDFRFEEVGEEFRTLYKGTPNEYVARFVIVEAEGTAVINGWKFIGTIDHEEGGNIVRKMVDEVEIPERYFTSEPICEHCNSKRHRKNTYIIYNEETGQFKQVGSSCLCDFTGGLSAEAVAGYISLFNEMIEGEAPYEGVHIEHQYRVENILRYAYYYVKHLGYTSTQSEYDESTRSKVVDAYLYDNCSSRLFEADKKRVEAYREKFNPDYESQEVVDYVQNAIKYVSECAEESSYVHNLKVITGSEYTKGANLGYLVSVVPFYNRYLDKQEYIARKKAAQKAEADSSEFIGNVGDRIEVSDLKDITAITSWSNEYGMTIRYKIVDNSGNVLMWDSSSGIDDDRDVKSIKGTIKKLDIYQGVKQTWLTRCRVAYAS